MAHTFTLELTSQFSELEKIPGWIDNIGRQIQLNDDLKQRLTLTLSEATTNAVIHGNREIEKKRVSISIMITEGSVIATVEDEGKGFDPTTIPNPFDTENLLKSGGRGLFLMDHYCDDVAYSNGGRTVTLTFNR